jgi:hypothetical protein
VIAAIHHVNDNASPIKQKLKTWVPNADNYTKRPNSQALKIAAHGK